MTETTTRPRDIEEALFMGEPLPLDGPELVVGDDFYDPDREPGSSVEAEDTLSAAMGTPGYMANYMVQECRQEFGDLSTEPCEFDRYYFAPQIANYSGPAPCLVDLLVANDAADQRREREEKRCEFKA